MNKFKNLVGPKIVYFSIVSCRVLVSSKTRSPFKRNFHVFKMHEIKKGQTGSPSFILSGRFVTLPTGLFSSLLRAPAAIDRDVPTAGEAYLYPILCWPWFHKNS